MGGMLAGIRPVWAAEIEPFPIRVTRKHFPDMEHLGNIEKINGGEIEPVDIVTFGSPCFPAGTQIMTKDGQKPIEKIVVGDMVMTHNRRWMPVTAIGSHIADTVILESHLHTLECTSNHPIYSKLDPLSEPEWTKAAHMKGRYWAEPVIDGATPFIWDVVRSVKPCRYNIPVYNFSVEEDESYVADSIVVHNCTNLAVCGNRTGIHGEKSRIFFDCIRIIREMREATQGEYPGYVVFENVFGAFSSGKGEDFHTIIKEFCSLAGERGFHVPRPKRWQKAGTILADTFSLAWRTVNAQYWNVPQSRRRIYLVECFRNAGGGE